MTLRKNRHAWICSAVLALGCADEVPTPVASGPAAGSSTGADAGKQVPGATQSGANDTGARVDAGTATVASSVDAGAPPAKTPAVTSCDDSTQASASGIQAAVAQADQHCRQDSDCKVTYLGSDCWHGCGAVVSASAQAALDAVVAEQDRTLCAGFEARGCFADEPPCDPPGAPACIGGECTEFEGLPSSAGDAGAASGPVALNASDTGKSVSLSVGQRLEVTLGTIGPANWGDPQLSSTSLRFAQRVLPRLQNPGGPTTVFVFQAAKVGTCEVTIDHPTRGPFKLTVAVH